MKKIGGMKILGTFWGGGGSPQNWTIFLGVISMHLRVFFKVKIKNEGIFFWAAKISNIFVGVLEIPDIVLGER